MPDSLWPHEPYSLPGCSVHGILQAGILAWVSMPSFRGSSWRRDQTHISYVSWIGRLALCHQVQFSLSLVSYSATPWTTARQASLPITNSWSPPKPMSIESVMPPNHLVLCRPLLLLPSVSPSITVFSNASALWIRWPKYWSLSFNISPSNEHPGMTSVLTCLCLAVTAITFLGC